MHRKKSKWSEIISQWIRTKTQAPGKQPQTTPVTIDPGAMATLAFDLVNE